MIQLIQVTSDEQKPDVRQLFSEFIQLLCETVDQEYGISLEVNATLQRFLSDIDDYYLPNGRIYLARYKGEITGVGCLKHLSDEVGEIKRMFVQPKYRRKGIGKEILDQLIADARSLGYKIIRLERLKAFSAAHNLYQSRGFQFIDPYPGSEGAKVYEGLFICMELVL
jgi:GNAT superfamily N-acetyltransferase